jgi:hypothetical protein
VIAVDEGGAFEQILREIAAQAKFRKNREVRAALMGGSCQAQNASGISCKITYGGIKLRERYFHARISGYGSLRLKANGAGCGDAE